jgi:hypothetical protein
MIYEFKNTIEEDGVFYIDNNEGRWALSKEIMVVPGYYEEDVVLVQCKNTHTGEIDWLECYL